MYLCPNTPLYASIKYDMQAVILGFITGFILTFLAIPPIVAVARVKKLYDQPNARSSHSDPTPSLGGIAIFGGMICGIILWTPPLQGFGDLQYILAALLIMFLIGMKDDLLPISPKQKFLAQIMAALILVYKAKVRITHLDGIFGVEALPEMASFTISMIAIVGIINAYNLIDGVNGLAGSVGILACLFFGAFFYSSNHLELAVVAFSTAGAVIAFLKYNFTPAKIFMGDTGALILGTICAIMALRFIEINTAQRVDYYFSFASSPAIALSVLIIPIYDTLRVFTRRMMQGKSPFHPDKTHIHHLLLALGCSHMQTTATLIAANIVFVGIAIALSGLGSTIVIFALFILALMASTWLHRAADRRKAHA